MTQWLIIVLTALTNSWILGDWSQEKAAKVPHYNDKPLSEWVDLAKNADTIVRRQALDVIENVAIPRLIEITKAKDFQSRYEAIMTLGLCRSFASSAIPTITALLKDDNESIRLWAALALKRINPDSKEALIVVLETLTKAQDDFDVASAALALGEFGPEAVEPILAALPRLNEIRPGGLQFGKSCASNGLAQIGKLALPALIRVMSDNNPIVRNAAADAVSLMTISVEEVQDAFPALRRLLDDPDAEVRRTAVRALQQWNQMKLPVSKLLRLAT